jgi:DHA2 family multidrug resistance protein-like MFS transporter
VLAWREYGQRGAPAARSPAHPIFALSIATSVCSFAAQMLAFVSLPFFFEGTLGRSAVDTGLLLRRGRSRSASSARRRRSLSDRFPRSHSRESGSSYGGGLAALAFTPAGAAWFDIAWRWRCAGSASACSRPRTTAP